MPRAGGGVLGAVIALARPAERDEAADALAALLGGRRLLVFVRDDEVGLLLPAPGFPQTLPDARAWRRFVVRCVEAGEASADALAPPDGGPPEPAYGVSCGEEVAAVVLGTDERAAAIEDLRDLLPLLAATLDRTRAVLQRTNAELAAARDEAQAASQAKSEFLATMSHELRTPLNAIGGHTQLIGLGLYGPVNEAQRNALERIDRSQRHLLGLINDVLNLARIAAGRVQYEIADVPLADLLREVTPMIEPQRMAKGLALEVHVGDRVGAVRADREKLVQILLNLLSNAVKFTGAGGLVTVECARRDEAPGLVFVRVTDTGMGVPPEKLERIFEPFVQVDSSHRRLGQGAGLGLAISRDLARGMGGDLGAQSAPGEGSTFTLTLPAA